MNKFDSFDTLQSVSNRLAGWDGALAILTFQKDEPVEIKYGDLDKNVEKIAGGIHQSCTGSGDYVAVMAPPGPGWITACMATIRAGAVVVPLDCQFDRETVKRILDEIEPRFLFTTRKYVLPLKEAVLGTTTTIVLLDDDDDQLSWRRLGQSPGAKYRVAKAEDTAALFYTSGTMGPPKGVPLSHSNIAFQINTLIGAALLTPRDRVLAPLPLHHIYPFVIEMLLPLSLGLPVVMPETLTGPQLTRAIGYGRATAIVGVPRLYAALWKIIEERFLDLPGGKLILSLLLALSTFCSACGIKGAGRFFFSPVHKQIGPELRLLASGGAALDAMLARNLEALGWPVVIGYGLTETSPLLSIKFPGVGHAGSVGKIVAGTEVRIASSGEAAGAYNPLLAKCREAEPAGEIQARGPGVFKGYHNLPQQTTDAIVDGGWFRTGDLGYLKDGELYVLGRSSALIIGESGEKIDPEQLEEHYLGNPLIKEIGVLQRSGKLAALIVPDLKQVALLGGGDVDRLVHDAVDDRSVHLPRYKRLSGLVISADPLPRTPMGKIQRHKLAAAFEAARRGANGKTSVGWEEMSAADHKLLEHPAAQWLWQYLSDRFKGLRLSPDSSVQLDLAVDSLEWVSLTLDIREQLGLELPEEALIGIVTVRDLLVAIIKVSENHSSCQNADIMNDPEKQLSEQQRLWLKPLHPVQQFLQDLLYGIDRGLIYALFRPRVSGLGALPTDQPLVFIPNHASYIDGFVLAAVLPRTLRRRLQWAGWTGLAFSNILTCSLSRIMRGIPIDPDRAARSSLVLASAVLKQGSSLVWFPEGRRTLTGELQPFKGGIGMLLEHFPGTLVVPVYLKDTGRALPPGSAVIRPIQVSVIFGEPISAFDLETSGQGERPRERIVAALHDAVQKLDGHNGDHVVPPPDRLAGSAAEQPSRSR